MCPMKLPPGDEEGKLFVGGLSWDTTKDSLQEYFCKYGEVIDCVVMKNQQTGKSRGFGFVTYKDPNCVNSVLSSGPHILDDRQIDPKSCNPRSMNKGPKYAEDKGKKVFVGGLPANVNEDDLRTFFCTHGKVTDVVIMWDQQKNRSRGFGFLSFESEDQVDRVCQQHFFTISGKQIEVKHAEPRDTRGTPTTKITIGTTDSVVQHTAITQPFTQAPSMAYAPPGAFPPQAFTTPSQWPQPPQGATPPAAYAIAPGQSGAFNGWVAPPSGQEFPAYTQLATPAQAYATPSPTATYAFSAQAAQTVAPSAGGDASSLQPKPTNVTFNSFTAYPAYSALGNYVQENSSYGPMARGATGHLAAAMQQQYTNTAFISSTANPHSTTVVAAAPQGNGFVTGVAIPSSSATTGEPNQAYVTGQVAMHRNPAAAAILNVAAAAAASQTVYSRSVGALAQTTVSSHPSFHPYRR